MKTELSHLVRQFQSVFDGQPWYGDSLFTKLEKIAPEEAFSTPTTGAHSVAQIAAHILVWRRFLIERLKGNSDFKVKLNSEQDWPSQEAMRSKGWEKILYELTESQREINALLSGETDELLARHFDGKRTFRSLIEGVIQHDIYHTGQIGLLITIVHKEKLLSKV